MLTLVRNGVLSLLRYEVLTFTGFSNKERAQALIEHFLYSEKEPLRDELLDLLEGDKPTLLERKPIANRILKKIVDFVETFINGVVGV